MQNEAVWKAIHNIFFKDFRLSVPKPCSGLDLNHVDKLYGAVERIIAVESVSVSVEVFLEGIVKEKLLLVAVVS